MITGICIDRQCKFKSRLSCFQCMKSNKSLDQNYDIRHVFQNPAQFFKFNENFNQYLSGLIDIQAADLRGKFEELMQTIMDTIKMIQEQTVEMFQQHEIMNQLKESLSHQYSKELEKLQGCFTQFQQGDQSNYEELEQIVSSYVELYYNPKNQEILETLQKIEKVPLQNKIEQIQLMNESQLACNNEISQILRKMNIQKSIWNSKLLSNYMAMTILQQESSKQLKKRQVRQLYFGIGDELDYNEFQSKCFNKPNTMIICKSVKGNVFGCYTPLDWINNNHYQYDYHCHSFLFSDNRNEIYYFGKCDNFIIFSDMTSCRSNAGELFEISDAEVDNPKTYLMGEENSVLAEIEVLQFY